jgi:hypothetical protein
MISPPLPHEVLRFIEERIDTVPELEALLMMAAQAHSWSVQDIAARTYVSLENARGILDSLQRRRLITREGASGRFVFDPADVQDRALVASVAQAYQSNLSLVAKLIHDKASGAIREFARAFDMKKDQ